jgi:hypothetical protein
MSEPECSCVESGRTDDGDVVFRATGCPMHDLAEVVTRTSVPYGADVTPPLRNTAPDVPDLR